ncbi:GNAT family N-acetyltransferase [Spirosoma sp. KUDC1026]|uniref:GNAT family N-acetyltransferase n=1 Tax=Spirosoma sp. KUDC1026 TaxID=2745947 RepID=UPI00159B920A|nr:GNAT family N-acetyltransferase [Spirosoma sp. KUDC1026]QKZ12389.1 GNAT family N-acetyltransferase [Spirosoma sp. KUDC1026]
MTILQTDRLLLREFTPDDASFMLELLTSPPWLRFIGDRGVRTIDDARQYIQNGPMKSYTDFGFGGYLVQLKAGHQPIGLCGLFRRETLPDIDLGFAFIPGYEGKGYGYEVASALLNYAQNQLHLARITAFCDPANQASIRLIEKLGLRFEKPIQFNGKVSSMYSVNLSGRSV